MSKSKITNIDENDCKNSSNQSNSNTPTINAFQCGRDYEGYIAMLFILRSVLSKYRFQVGVEIEQAHKFDDVLLLYEKRGKQFSRCLQAKHTTAEKKKIDSMNLLTGEQSDFSMVKYFFSFKDLVREDYFEGITQEDLIVYTNCPLDINSVVGPKMILSSEWKPFESMELNVKNKKVKDLLETIKSADNILDKNNENSNRYKFHSGIVKILKSKANEFNVTRTVQALINWLLGIKKLQHVEYIIRPYWKFLKDEILKVDEKQFYVGFVNSDKKVRTKEAQLFRQKLMAEIDRKNKQNKKKGNVEMLSVSYLNEKMQEINEFPNWEVTDEKFKIDNVIKEAEIETFLDLFVFAVSQPNRDTLKDMIKADILEEQRKKYGDDDFYTEEDIKRYVEDIFQHFHEEIFKWKDIEVDRKKKNGNEIKYMTDESSKQFVENQWEEVKFDVRTPLVSFMGRDKDLDSLHKKIGRGETVKSQTNVICGLPGIGKTELTRSYIQKHCRRYENKILWIDGRSSDSIEKSFRELAETLNIPTKTYDGEFEDIEKVVSAVYREFQSKKCLFVFDDSPNQELVDSFTPKETQKGNLPFIIITSSNSNWDLVQKTDLSVLTKEHAVKLVENQAAIKESTEIIQIERLVQILEFFPLAIQQAVAYIVKETENNPQFTIVKLIDNFSKYAKNVLEFPLPEGMNFYEKPTYTSLKNSLDSISFHETFGKRAFEIVGIMSFMATDDFDLCWFIEYFKMDLHHIYQHLKEYSLVRIESGTINIHSLVQMVTRLIIKQQSREQIFLDKTCSFFLKIYPKSDSMLDFAMKRKLMPHLEIFIYYINKICTNEQKTNYLEELLWMLSDCYSTLIDPKKEMPVLKQLKKLTIQKYGNESSEVATVNTKIGNLELSLGNYARAKSHYEKVLAVILQNYGLDHIETANVMMNLGTVESNLGNYAIAKSQYEKVLNVYSQIYGEDYVQMTIVIMNLGNIELQLGNYSRAKSHYERVLAIRLQKYGEDHVATATIKMNLGNVELKLGNYSLAKSHYEQVLAVRLQNYGENHVQMAIVMMSLGTVELQLGNYSSAKSHFEKGLTVSLQNNGVDHVLTPAVKANLGIVESHLSNYATAKFYFQKVLDGYLQNYGLNHVETATVMMNLGNVELKLRNYGTAKSYYEKVLPVRLQNNGENHVQTASVLLNLGNAEIYLGNSDTAKSYFEKALLVYLQNYGVDHVETANVMISLGTVESELGNYARAKSHYEKVLYVYLQNYGEDHVLTATVMMNLGNIELQLGNYSTGKSHYDKVLAVRLENYGIDHVETASVMMNLGNMELLLGNYSTGKFYYEKVLAVCLENYGVDHVETTNVMLYLGTVELNLGNYVSAKSHSEKVLDVCLQNYGGDHVQTTTVMMTLGNVELQLGNYATAKSHYEKVLAVRLQHYGENHVQTACVIMNLGIIESNLGNHIVAKSQYEKVLAVRLQNYGKNHVETADVMVNLGNAESDLGNHAEAKLYYEKVLAIYSIHYGKENPKTMQVYNELTKVNEILINPLHVQTSD